MNNGFEDYAVVIGIDMTCVQKILSGTNIRDLWQEVVLEKIYRLNTRLTKLSAG